MIVQDAGQVNTYWCYGELPEPMPIYTASGLRWLVWTIAPVTAGST